MSIASILNTPSLASGSSPEGSGIPEDTHPFADIGAAVIRATPPVRMRPARPPLHSVRINGTSGPPPFQALVQVSEPETSSSTFCPIVGQFLWLHSRQGTPCALCPMRGRQCVSDIRFAPLPDGRFAPVPSHYPRAVKRASARLSTGDLVPTWFQLEPTVHTAITAE